MGVDITLGLIVLVNAVRGYLRGFVLQAARLGALVAGVYLADPIREYARPHVHPQFPTIGPALLDRMVWWAGAVVTYLTIFGLASWLYKSSRRRPLGEPEPDRADQGAGFVLGAAKGVLVASALALVIDQYALGHLKNVAWLEAQSRDSKGLEWSRKYQLAKTFWESPPVQSLVMHVRRNGLLPMPGNVDSQQAETAGPGAMATPSAGRQAALPAETPLKLPQPPPLTIPKGPRPEPGSPSFLRDFDRALDDAGIRPAPSRSR